MQHILRHQRVVRAMHRDALVHAALNDIPDERARRARPHQVKVQAVLAERNAPATLDARPLDSHAAAAADLRRNEALPAENGQRSVAPVNGRACEGHAAVEIGHLCLRGHHAVQPRATMAKP